MLLGWENDVFPLEASRQGASSHAKKSMKAQLSQKLRAFENEKMRVCSFELMRR